MYQTTILVGNLGKEPEMRYTPQRAACDDAFCRHQPQPFKRQRAAGKGNHLVPRDGLGQTGRNLQPIPPQGEQGAGRRPAYARS